MINKKGLVICFILCLFTLNIAFASDANDTIILNEKINSNELSITDENVQDSTSIYYQSINMRNNNLDANDDADILDSADDEDVISVNGNQVETYVEVNSYDISEYRPHSVNVNNDSDYVARIHAPSQAGGSVSLSIGEYYDEARVIFSENLQSLDHEIDENDTDYSTFYIRPSDIIEDINAPNLYYVSVVYNYGLTLNKSDEGYVRFVEDSRHVIVDAPSEIVIGSWFNNYISIYVEGTLGYLRVLRDNAVIINDSVFNLRYINETDEFRDYILVYMDDLPIGEHTYSVSYYGGNWEDVTFSDTIDVTYLFDIYVDSDEVYYGDDVNFIIELPYDAGSNEIKVNGTTYEIDVDYGFANLTLSDFELGENILLFTYNDAKYGEKSVFVYLNVYPKLYVPNTVRYGSGDKIILKLPSDAQGRLNISIYDGYFLNLVDSVEVVNGEANYSFDSWNIGSYEVLVEYDGEKYNVSNETYILIIPNVVMPNCLFIEDDFNVTIVSPENSTGNLTVKLFNGTDDEEIIGIIYDGPSKGSVVIDIPRLGVGNYGLQVTYHENNQENITFTYDFEVRNSTRNWTIEAEVLDFNIFSNDYGYYHVKNLPDDADGILTLYIDGKKVTVDNCQNQDYISFNAYNFVLGVHDWEVRFTNDSYYSDTSASGTFEVIWIDVPEIVYAGVDDYNYIVFYCNFQDISGYLLLNIDGEEYAMEFVKYSYTIIPLDNLDIGVHDYEIIYSGDENYGRLTKIGSFEVCHYFDINITEGAAFNAGIPLTVNVKIAKTATGNVTIELDGKNYTQPIIEGNAKFTIEGLTPGNYTIAARYHGDLIFPAQEVSRNFTVGKYKIIAQYINNESSVIKSVSLTLPADANGNLVAYNQTGVIGIIALVNGIAVYEFNHIEFDKNYTGYILYEGDDYDVERLDYSFYVSPIVDFDNKLVIGEDAYITVYLFGISGNITVFVNGENLTTEELSSGKINVTIPSARLHLGNNFVTLKYEGDDLDKDPFYYYDSDIEEYVPYMYRISVEPKELNIPDEFPASGSGIITLELPEGLSGNITVYVNNKKVSTTPVSGGKVNISVSGLKTGDNTVKIVFNDEEGYAYEASKTVSVPKPVPQVDIATPKESTVPKFTISLPSDATGSLIVNINGKNYVSDLVNGKSTISIPNLPDGTYNVTIKYTGDSKYNGFSKKTTVKIKTYKDPKLKITVANIYQGKKAVVKITADSTFTGKVTVKIGSKSYVVSVVKGKGTKSISGLKVGTYKAIAKFAGNNIFKSSTNSVKFKVKANVIKLTLKKVKVKKSAKKLIIKATLKINGKAVKGKKLKFKFNKKVYKAKTNKKGVAKITIKKKVLKKLKVGKKVKYQVTYGKKTVKRTVKVKK